MLSLLLPQDVPTHEGLTPLHLAAASGSEESVQVLLAHGACHTPRTR